MTREGGRRSRPVLAQPRFWACAHTYYSSIPPTYHTAQLGDKDCQTRSVDERGPDTNVAKEERRAPMIEARYRSEVSAVIATTS